MVHEGRLGSVVGGDPGDAPINGSRSQKREEAEPLVGGKSGRARSSGIALMAFVVLTWVPAVLLFPLSGAQKIWTTSALLVAGEVFRRYRVGPDSHRPFGGRG